ncbi:MBL fold metallo-hydrolase [Bermanella marisrubri]|uniref:Beta-lactamase-like protein n=1 Tax=Bermanella marisrubri TaxID=207949 RepID=Q1N0S3_9GAMM|nr:MBL fold metallo-hydrolase [Bermanella marisrubri]EAT11760.1 Beta-lactamase-like protein [Oceanobacter sp. RED65] [Bermanella marisrubri]QIZ83795.1 MBL fold metallo-hydrolase [Bermanella marisrubri]
MKFCSIGSGSKGNGTLVAYRSTRVLIDNGFTLKEFENRLARKGLTPLDLSAILITHEHSDHIKGVGPLARKYRIPVYASHGTAQYHGLGDIPSLRIFDSHGDFVIGDLQISPVVVPHDAREPTQFVIKNNSAKLGILTDLGSLTPYILEAYAECQALMLETNHDVQMLRAGPYPPKLKRRVEGNLGHLNNEQAAWFLSELGCAELKYLVATHISEQNNSKELAVSNLQAVTQWPAEKIIVADQENGFDWCDLSVDASIEEIA